MSYFRVEICTILLLVSMVHGGYFSHHQGSILNRNGKFGLLFYKINLYRLILYFDLIKVNDRIFLTWYAMRLLSSAAITHTTMTFMIKRTNYHCEKTSAINFLLVISIRIMSVRPFLNTWPAAMPSATK